MKLSGLAHQCWDVVSIVAPVQQSVGAFDLELSGADGSHRTTAAARQRRTSISGYCRSACQQVSSKDAAALEQAEDVRVLTLRRRRSTRMGRTAGVESFAVRTLTRRPCSRSLRAGAGASRMRACCSGRALATSAGSATGATLWHYSWAYAGGLQLDGVVRPSLSISRSAARPRPISESTKNPWNTRCPRARGEGVARRKTLNFRPRSQPRPHPSRQKPRAPIYRQTSRSSC